MNSKWVWLIIILFGVDQASKLWVEAVLPLRQEIPLIPFLSLFRTYNEGVAFSFLSGFGPWPLIGLTLIILVFIMWLWRALPEHARLGAFGYSLVISGAIGNLVDRVRLGKVIDMIYFHIEAIGFHFAIFNLADTFITLGATAIILDEFLRWRASRKPS